MTAYTHQSIDYVGTNISFTAVSGIDTAVAGTRAFLWVKNASGVSTSVLVSIPGTTFEQANPDVSVTVPAGQERLIGPLSPELGQPDVVGFIISPTTSVTAAAITLPTPPPDFP